MFRQKNDSVFQLSLTELAFVLTFVILLLIGSKFVFMDTGCRKDIESCNAARSVCEKEKQICFDQLPTILGDPKAAIDSLVNEPKLRAENESLKKILSAKDAELKALEQLKKNIPNAAEVAKALSFLKGFEEVAKKSVPPELATNEGQQAAAARKDLENCRGQLSHCVVRAGGTKGYGHPPCWTDPSGGIEYLFEVEIRADGLKVSKAWPPGREEDAKALSGAFSTVEKGIQSLANFKEATRSIYDASKKADPECRHYVVLTREPGLKDIDQFNALRLGVEDFFYKFDKTGTANR